MFLILCWRDETESLKLFLPSSSSSSLENPKIEEQKRRSEELRMWFLQTKSDSTKPIHLESRSRDEFQSPRFTVEEISRPTPDHDSQDSLSL
jgi:hypothetical protein